MDKVDDIVIILGKESDSNTYIIGDKKKEWRNFC